MKFKTDRNSLLYQQLRKVIERPKWLPWLLMMVGGMIVGQSWLVPSSHAFNNKAIESKIMIDAREVKQINTQKTYLWPVPNDKGLSQKYHKLHHGIDIRANKGEKIVNIADGVVIEVKEISWGYGRYIRVAHKGTITSLYAHLDKLKVKVGDIVKQGDELGTIGVSGWTTGPHLHFEISKNNQTIDPMLMLSSN